MHGFPRACLPRPSACSAPPPAAQLLVQSPPQKVGPFPRHILVHSYSDFQPHLGHSSSSTLLPISSFKNLRVFPPPPIPIFSTRSLLSPPPPSWLSLDRMPSSTSRPAATSSYAANPSTPSYSNDLDWITAYLTIHCSSVESEVYTYVLWIVIAVVLVLCTTLHLFGVKAGTLGAHWTKWALRRRTWRKKHSLAIAKRRGLPWKPPLPLPSNAQILTLCVLIIVSILLSFIGPDYIAPGYSLWTLGQSPTAPILRREIPPAENPAPQYTIPKAWWTSSNRIGLTAFALFPLCVLFALKAPPFALFALPFVVDIHFDKFAWLHRWSGRLIWFVTTLHVAFWSVQLLDDHRDGTGKVAYTYAWDFQRFIFAWTAYGTMTLLILLSIRPIRNNFYEAFYFLHILLIPMTIILSALHHPQVWWWCGAALFLWFGERVWRFVWWLHVNGFFGGMQPSMPVTAAPQKPEVWQVVTPYGVQQPNSQTNPLVTSIASLNSLAYPPPSSSIPFLVTPGRYVPPPGYAYAELLPGRTVRLRLITPGFRQWAPGQHFLLCVPAITHFTSHPFTVSSICDEQAPTDEGRELVFVIRAKNGWTKDLWDAVALAVSRGQRSLSGEKIPSRCPIPQRGVLMRAWVDGPFGSAARARWGQHSTALIIAGGSGVSFGLSVLQYVCLCLAGRDGRHLGGQRGGWGNPRFKTTRVRFVWVVREFGHILWGASILRRCMAMIPPSELQVDIFVTNVQPNPNAGPTLSPLSPLSAVEPSKQDDNLTPPNPRFTREERRSPDKQRSRPASPADGESDAEPDTWTDNVDLSYYTGDYIQEQGELGHEEHVLDLTNFEGDDDTALPGERMLHISVKREGRIRREKTRRRSAILLAKKELDIRVDTQQVAPPPGQLPSQHLAESRVNLSPLDESRERLVSPITPQSASSTAPLLSPEHPMTALRAPAGPSREGYGTPNRSRRDSALSQVSVWSDTHSVAALVTKEDAEQLRLELDDQEMQDVNIVAEQARPGRPKVDRILADEVERAKGSIVVGCCGPTSLNALIRKAIAAQIDPARIARGDMRGSISMISEDFEY